MASAVLATAYVSAINGKHYVIAAVIAMSEAGLATVTYVLGRRERRSARAARPALRQLQGRIADRLKMDEFRMQGQPPAARAGRLAVRIVFASAVMLSIAAALYALIH